MSDMFPTLYDVLGVAPDATREEIRAAWRDAADRFEPGEGGSTRQFRLFNEAAEVLLDPERRRAYDAELAGRTPEAPVEPAEDRAHEPVPGPPMPGTAAVTTVAPGSTGSSEVTAQPVDRGTEPGAERPADEPAVRRRAVPWWVPAVLGALAAVAVGLGAYFLTQAGEAEAYQEALDRAPGAAEAAAVAVLSYDHETLEADRANAAKYLTDEYADKYLKTFDEVAKTAPQVKATVEAEVLASAPIAVGGGERDPDRVSVLVFVDQVTTSAAKQEPTRALNRAQLDMVRVDGTWLVDGITSY